MIYLVTKNQSLFSPENYKIASFEEAMEVLKPIREPELDTETMGLDAHTKALLTLQLGNKENQVVFDWQSLTTSEKAALKEYLESDRLFLGWNLMFDLCFLYVQGIWIKNIWDGMIGDKLIFLGYPAILTPDVFSRLSLFGYEQILDEDTGKVKYYELSYSLKAALKRWCNEDIDKSVRGKIINNGLTEEVVVYAAGDVAHIGDIKKAQEKALKAQNLEKAMRFECEFIKAIAYAKHCGVHLDKKLWKAKMEKDYKTLKESEEALNNWVVQYFLDNDSNIKKSYKEIYFDEDDSYSYQRFLGEQRMLEIKGYTLEDQYVENKKHKFVYKGIDISNIHNKFLRVDTQLSLFEEYDPKPKCNINWSSSKQVIPLFELLGIKVKTFDKKTKTEKKSIEEKQLAPQADLFPIIPLYLKYQGACKVVSTYGENWLKAINPKTGRIHVEFHSIGTDTARVSSGGGVYKLNLQFGGSIV